MTINESEIRRRFCNALLTSGHNCKFSPYHPAIHSALCDEMTGMCVTALAAEREQHARDVAEARAETWLAALSIAGERASWFTALCKADDYKDQHNQARRYEANTILIKLQEARAQALNDSRNGEQGTGVGPQTDGSSAPGGLGQPGNAGCASPVPPSGINQGSGAGETEHPCADCGALRTKAEGGTTFTVCDACWAKAYPPPPPASPTGLPWFCRGCGEANPAVNDRCRKCRALETWCGEPASPTGETRDERRRAWNEATQPREPGCQCDQEVGDSPCRVHGDEGDAPHASAPGGAPGVETCGFEMRLQGQRCQLPDGHDPGNRHAAIVRGPHGDEAWELIVRGTGTTPTPSTETPTLPPLAHGCAHIVDGCCPGRRVCVHGIACTHGACCHRCWEERCPESTETPTGGPSAPTTGGRGRG